jgi:hypothetical protein
MGNLRLAKLPERSPIKLSITLTPELNQALRDYADAYEQNYGSRETVTDLIPFMLVSFIEGDRTFLRSRRKAS